MKKVKTKVIRIPVYIAEEIEREIKVTKRDMSAQLEWWITLGVALERDFPEYLDEVIKKITEYSTADSNDLFHSLSGKL